MKPYRVSELHGEQARTIDGGDRVRIQQGSRPLHPELVDRMGTVIEVFRVPRDSCLVRIDGDPNRRREWFLYQDEVVISDVEPEPNVVYAQ